MSGVPHRMCRMPQKISLVCLFFFHALRFEKMGGSASPILSAHHHSASEAPGSDIGGVEYCRGGRTNGSRFLPIPDDCFGIVRGSRNTGDNRRGFGVGGTWDHYPGVGNYGPYWEDDSAVGDGYAAAWVRAAGYSIITR